MLLWLSVYMNGLQNRLIFEVIVPPENQYGDRKQLFQLEFTIINAEVHCISGTERNEISPKFQRLPPIFETQQFKETIANSTRHNRKSEIQDGGRLTGITYNSACRLDSNVISTASPTFSRSSISMGPLRILPDITRSRKSKMAAAKPELLITQLETR